MPPSRARYTVDTGGIACRVATNALGLATPPIANLPEPSAEAHASLFTRATGPDSRRQLPQRTPSPRSRGTRPAGSRSASASSGAGLEQPPFQSEIQDRQSEFQIVTRRPRGGLVRVDSEGGGSTAKNWPL